MKRSAVLVIIISLFLALPLYAQTGGQKGEKGGMMSKEMLQSMSGMMSQMNELLQKMSHPMGHRTVTEHVKMHEMATIMRDMATQMNEMSAHMEKGGMDQASAKKMHNKLEEISRSIEKIQKESK